MNVLVTGATGFLGQSLTKRLAAMGFQVTATGRNQAIGKQLENKHVTFVPADLRDAEAIKNLCRQQEVVFHCGALSAPWGPYQDFYQINYLGTKHIIAGCQQHQVRRLIHISTPSIYNRSQDQLNLTEASPIPQRKINAYAETKWLAEQAIDAAVQEGLPVITLRPRAIFGPKDPSIFPRLLQAYDRSGIPLFKGGNNQIDITYIDNVVDACILCLNAPDSCFGKKYNITNDDPRTFLELLELLFRELQMPLKTKKIPYPIAHLLAIVLETAHKLFAPTKEPLLTRYALNVIGVSQTFDISLAKKELGYSPKVSIEEGMQRFADWWRKQQCLK